jgi:hypothetical protein
MLQFDITLKSTMISTKVIHSQLLPTIFNDIKPLLTIGNKISTKFNHSEPQLTIVHESQT